MHSPVTEMCHPAYHDNIFEVKAATAMRTCYSEDPDILLTDFPAPTRGVLETLPFFLRGIYVDWQFAMMRSVQQGCPASGHLFTMAFDPVFRWLLTSALPPRLSVR